MARLAVELSISNYSRWREGFDLGKSFRAGAGLTNEHVYRHADTLTEVLVVSDATDVQRAYEMFNNPALRARMQESGVIGPPRIYIMQK